MDNFKIIGIHWDESGVRIELENSAGRKIAIHRTPETLASEILHDSNESEKGDLRKDAD